MVLIGTIVVGFAMMTLGVALLCIGEAPFIAGRRLSAMRSRLIGAVLTGFLPLALVVRSVCAALFGADAVEGPIVTSLVFSVCCVATLAILFRVMFPKRSARTPVQTPSEPAKANPFAKDQVMELEIIDDEVMELEIIEDEPARAQVKSPVKRSLPPNKTPAKKPSKPAAEPNPFDFN